MEVVVSLRLLQVCILLIVNDKHEISLALKKELSLLDCSATLANNFCDKHLAFALVIFSLIYEKLTFHICYSKNILLGEYALDPHRRFFSSIQTPLYKNSIPKKDSPGILSEVALYRL